MFMICSFSSSKPTMAALGDTSVLSLQTDMNISLSTHSTLRAEIVRAHGMPALRCRV